MDFKLPALILAMLALASAAGAQEPRVFLGRVTATWTAPTGPVQVYLWEYQLKDAAEWVGESLRSPESSRVVSTPLGVPFRARVSGVESNAVVGPASDPSAYALLVTARCDRKRDGIIRIGAVSWVAWKSMTDPANTECDVNGDGSTTYADVRILADHFGWRWCPTPSGRDELMPLARDLVCPQLSCTEGGPCPPP